MKVEELMIGDWVDVYCENPDESGFYRPGQIRGIYGDEICFGDNSDCPWFPLNEPDTIEPIPLTAEILNKNKFPYAPLANGWFIGDLFLKGENGLYSVGANIRIEDIGVYYTFTQIQYIHELQHLMRLLKIEKDIKI